LTAITGCDSWGEVHAKWANFTEKEKGDCFEDLTQAFLQLSPLYRSQLKSVWRLEEVPPAVRQKLKLPATDKGIDLVAETHKGEFWAIQCKYRQNTDQQLTHTDISTFTSLTFQACKGFSFALVCSTTERVTSLYRGEERIGFCALDTWQELDTEFFDQLRAKLTNKPAVLTPCSPRPHQQNAVRDGLEHFARAKAARGKLIMPCGTGKSLTAWFLAQALGSKRIVIAVPSLSLVKQTLKVWNRESAANDIDVDWICVCSDETAGKADQDDVVVQRQDIAVPCHTSTDKIADWLRTDHKGLTVVFTTYQSGDVLATAARKAKFTFDLGIMDEAHKTVGDSDKQFSILLHDHNIEISQRVFMTATERRYKGSSDKVLSMDNVEIYGDTFHQLSFKQAMEAEKPILCDYNVITIGVSRQEIKDLIKKNVFVRPTGGKWDEEMEADMLAAMVALRKAMKEHPIKHAVSFHGSIQRAELFKAHNDTFTREFPEFGGLDTFHVSGQTPTGTRSNIIKAFAQAERSLVTNARCLTEGVDVPGIDCVLFADPRKSTVDIVQAVGRALRPSEGKKLGYVILPVLHETDATSEQVIDSGAFKEILSTISALAANDDRIIEYFRGISQGRNPSGSSRVSFEWDERLAQNIDVAKLVHELEIKCWGRLAKLSWRPFEEARAWARSQGFKTWSEWLAFCAGKRKDLGIRPADIPSNPDKNYKNSGWVSISDWIGSDYVSAKFRNYLPFEEARKWAMQCKAKSYNQWIAFIKEDDFPEFIPRTPEKTYAEAGWISYGDWLGTGALSPADYKDKWLPFEAAREWVHMLRLKGVYEWRDYLKGKMPHLDPKPANIPANPDSIYKGKGWIGYGDWVGTGFIHFGHRVYLPFEEARAIVRNLELSSANQWRLFCKGKLPDKGLLPANIPATPYKAYLNTGWVSWGDWLGTNTVAVYDRIYRPFEEARRFVHGLKLGRQKDWDDYSKGLLPDHLPKPDDIPAAPSKVYAGKGWEGYGDWLGTERVATHLRVYRNFHEARDFIRSLNFKTKKQWGLYLRGTFPGKGKCPEDIPRLPDVVYADDGWISYPDWLGVTTATGPGLSKTFLPFDSARTLARSLRLKTSTVYLSSKLPPGLPRTPQTVYKTKGWVNWTDWLTDEKA
jgi:superfamily II DNA or RNA helicase